MDLATLWFALVVLCWVLFAVLEGFDFGVGMLAGLLGRDEHERAAAIRTVGPVWDGNEVWLVAAIGVTFAAFPDWYAALLSGLYLPLVAVLLALAARGVALEFRGKVERPRWRRRCDVVLGVSSLLCAAGFGAVGSVSAPATTRTQSSPAPASYGVSRRRAITPGRPCSRTPESSAAPSSYTGDTWMRPTSSRASRPRVARRSSSGRSVSGTP